MAAWLRVNPPTSLYSTALGTEVTGEKQYQVTCPWLARKTPSKLKNLYKNSVDFSPQTNYTDPATVACRQS
jgi:hypothetical protein